jgi:adenylate cyclase, class 2
MPLEIEIKLRITAPEAVRARLIAAGAQRCRQVLEHNQLFDTPDNTLRTAGCGLRIREAAPFAAGGQRPAQTVLTFKGARRPGELKIREEIETEVGDAPALQTILNRVGFRAVVSYEKRRESWLLAGCEVTLDEMPRLGWFAEIETSDPQTIPVVRAQLGLEQAEVVPESYVELAARHGEKGADGAVRLKF